jgi:hypothetical protein
VQHDVLADREHAHEPLGGRGGDDEERVRHDFHQLPQPLPVAAPGHGHGQHPVVVRERPGALDRLTRMRRRHRNRRPRDLERLGEPQRDPFAPARLRRPVVEREDVSRGVQRTAS